jgi:GT2 family glycosyltransferase
VIIPTFRRDPYLVKTLYDLAIQDYQTLEVVIADQNQGHDPKIITEIDSLKTNGRQILLLSERPPGVVAARNEAVRRSRGQILMFMDDDVRIEDSEFVRKHVENYRDRSVSAVCGCELTVKSPCRILHKFSFRNSFEEAISFPRNHGGRAIACVFSTCNGSIRREAFLAVGGFDEQFGGNSYGDDTDLALRLRDAGHRIVYDPNPWLFHLLAGTGGLRLGWKGNPFGEADRLLSAWVFFWRHVRGRFALPYLYGHILRRSILLRQNFVRPWRWPKILLAVVISSWRGFCRVRQGPTSCFVRAAANPEGVGE